MPYSTKVVITSAIISALLVVAYLTVLLRDEPKLGSPLINMNIEQEIKRNAVLELSAPIIPGVIDKNITKGTYILRGQAVVPQGADITILPNTTIYAERDAQITVEGKLTAVKSTWLSNQAHPSKQYWHGLIAKNGGTINVSETNISNATAGITVEKNGVVNITKSVFDKNLVGIVTFPDSNTKITDSKFTHGTVGAQILGGRPEISNCVFSNLQDGLRIFHGALPQLTGNAFQGISRSAIRYSAEKDLIVRESAAIPPTSNPEYIFDSEDQPMHKFGGQEYKTGRVILNNKH